jgi:hypothetical protein
MQAQNRPAKAPATATNARREDFIAEHLFRALFFANVRIDL